VGLAKVFAPGAYAPKKTRMVVAAMKVTIERAALLRALGHVHRVVERRTTIPILANVLIDARDGALMLKATDLDLEITEKAAAEVGQPGARVSGATILSPVRR